MKDEVKKNKQKLLAVFAHPDDETLLAGHILAYFSKKFEIFLVCIIQTNQERVGKLYKASKILGIKQINIADFNADNPELVDNIQNFIYNQIQILNPQLILTHSINGDYGHQDHINVYKGSLLAYKQNKNNIQFLSLYWNPILIKMNFFLLKIFTNKKHKAQVGSRTKVDILKLNTKEFIELRRKAAQVYDDEINRGPLPLKLIEKSPLIMQKWIFGNTKLIIEA